MADEQALVAAQMPPAVRAFEAVSKLVTAAFIDRKAGLLNAAALEVFREEYDRDPKVKVAVVFVDLAGFKAVNDVHGHDAGDTAIGVAGSQLQGLAKQHGGQAYRHGGDEFVVIVPEQRLRPFVKSADQQMRVIVLTWQDAQIQFGATLGYCRARSRETLETLIERADTACRRAKALDGKPREWTANDKTEVPESVRRRCNACRTTTSLLVYPSKRTKGCLATCPNCGAELPPDTPSSRLQRPSKPTPPPSARATPAAASKAKRRPRR